MDKVQKNIGSQYKMSLFSDKKLVVRRKWML